MPIITRSKAKDTALIMVNNIEIEKKARKRKQIDSNSNEFEKENMNKLIKKSDNNNVPDAKRVDKENQNDSSDSTFYEKQISQLQKVLSDKYVDVIDRLKLNYIPNCVRDIWFCKSNHSKNCIGPPVISKIFTYRMNQFIVEKRPINYLKICNNVMQQGLIPDENILNSIFQLIISHRFEDEALHYTNDYLLNESKLTLINFINLFPPCWKGVRQVYVDFCSDPIEPSKYLPENSEPVEHRNMFLFVLYLIEKIASEDDKFLSTTLDKTNSIDNSVAESEIILNFNEWETKNSSNNNINAYNREEKLNRLFLTLDIFVRMFEVDLSLWILRYLTKPYKHLFTCDKPLIIAALLIKESNFMSKHVVKIIELFVKLIFNNYPRSQITAFKRLLSLIYVVINLGDAEEDVTKYPNFKLKSKTAQFAKEIFYSLEKTAGLNFVNFFKIYEYVEIPHVRSLIVDQFIMKLDGEIRIDYFNPKTIYDSFKKLFWQTYEISPNPINIREIQPYANDIPCAEPLIKYPKICDTIFKKPVLKIYRDEYLYLHLEALKTYCEAFFTKNFLLILMDCNILKPTIVLTKEIKTKKLNKKLNLEKLEKDASKLLMKIDLDKDFCNIIENEIPEYGVEIDSDIILQYRTDYKYLSLLKKNLPTMMQRFGKQFDIFNDFIEFCFTPE